MVDCGATGDFIDEGFVKWAKIPTWNLSQPIPVYNVDGTLNKAGSITKVADMIMTYKGHLEWILLTVTQLGKQDTILGMTWLKKHNPEIDFTTGTVQLSHCSPHCCTGCWAEIHEEHYIKKEEAQVVNTCQTGPLPAFVEDAEDEEDVASDEPTEDPLEEGDQIWATGLMPKLEYIQATSLVSQLLAKAFKRNSKPQDYEKHIPPYLCEFHSVFSKESFVCSSRKTLMLAGSNLPNPQWLHQSSLSRRSVVACDL